MSSIIKQENGFQPYHHALPELRWVKWKEKNRSGETIRTGMTLQQRWRIVQKGEVPRHEWRDVPIVKEGEDGY